MDCARVPKTATLVSDTELTAQHALLATIRDGATAAAGPRYDCRPDDRDRNDDRQVERLEEYPRRQTEDRRDRSPPACAILGALTAEQLARGGNVDPLQDLLQLPSGVADTIARALFNYRFTGNNAGNLQRLVMKDKDRTINWSRLREEYRQVVSVGPRGIRWAKEHVKLNYAEIDPRLLDEVTARPNLPDAVKARVRELLHDEAKRVQAGDYYDDDDDNGPAMA